MARIWYQVKSPTRVFRHVCNVMSQERHYTLHRGSSTDRSAPLDCQNTPLFELHASAPTDLWRKPPVEAFNAPSLTTRIRTEQFVSARVTVSGAWKRLYDQAGLIFLWPLAGKQPSDGERNAWSHSRCLSKG